MTQKRSAPVLFFAFANDQDERAHYLRRLAEEARRIRKALEDMAVRNDLCELVIRQNATVDEVLDVFQDPKYRDHIAVFHFGGHANSYQLLLEDAQGKRAVADAGGLSAFLGLQKNLKLVFLNGCSTEPQVQGLLDANVPFVIATLGPIDDQMAADFAARFYQALGSGRNLGTSYDEAVAALQTKAGGNPRHLYLSASPLAAAPTDRWPWIRRVRPGAEITLAWSLPEAANDPLFGLPPIPEKLWRKLPECPFRGLDWFTREDAPIFFGRGCEIRELYQQITAPRSLPLILFYGQSGVGKSSLLAAGLLPRLEQSYTICYQRRNQTIGLLGALQAALPEHGSGMTLAAAWGAIEARDGRPLLVILDQVEEVFTRPNPERPYELAEFLEALSGIFTDTEHHPQGKLILSFRKDWLAEAKRQVVEQRLPHAEVFLQRLSDRGVVEAIEGPTRAPELQAKYRLTVEGRLPAVIADDLLADRESAVAPTLQILLTKMWERAKRIRPDQPCFDHALYDELRQQGLGLDDVLAQQLAELEQHQPDVMHSGLALDVLAYHTTALGTAAEHTSVELRQNYQHRQETLEPLVHECEDLYLLVDPAKHDLEKPPSSRLAHDTLAPLVRRCFDESDAPGQRARRILENRAVEWTEGRSGGRLDEADLKVVEIGKDGMRVWTNGEQRLIEASQKERQQKRIRRLRWLGAGTLILLLLVGISVFAYDRWRTELVQRAERQSLALVVAAMEAERNDDTERMTAFVVEANRTEQAPELAQRALARLVYYSPGTRRLFLGHTDAVISVAFSPDGSTALSGSADRSVILWDVESTENPMIQRFEAHVAAVTSVAYDPTNPRRFASGSKDGTVILWNIDGGNRRTFQHTGGVNSVAFHPDGNFVLAGTDDGEVVLWDLGIGEARWRHRSADIINCVTFTPDGSKAVAGTHHGGPDADTIYVWEVESGEEIHRIPHAANYGVASLAVSPDNRFILAGAGGYGPPIYLVDIEAGAISRTLQGHVGGDVRVSFDPSSLQYAATGSYDNQIILWDIQNGWELQRFTGHTGRITGLVFSPDGRHVLSGSTDKSLRLWDIASGAERIRYEGNWQPTRSLACSRDGQTVAVSYRDHTVFIWRDNELWDQFKLESAVMALDISPNGELLLAGLARSDRNLVVWSLIDKIEVRRLEQDGWVTAIAFSPVDATIALVSSYGLTNQPGFPRGRTLILWDLTAGAVIHDLSQHQHVVQTVAFSQDGKWALSGSADRSAILWDLDKGEKHQMLAGHTEAVTGVAFVPSDPQRATTADQNPRRAMTTSQDGTIIVWNIQSEPPAAIQLLKGHNSIISSIDASEDGRYAVSGDRDGEIKVWDLESGSEVANLVGHSGAVSKVSFCGSAHLVLSAGREWGQVRWDTTVRLWDFELPEDIIAWTDTNRYVRELTCAERAFYQIEPMCAQIPSD